MITFWTTRAGRFGIMLYLESRGQALRQAFDVRDYESLEPRVRLAGGTHIVSAVDQLTPAQRAAVTQVHEGLRAARPSVRFINAPQRVQLRYELTTTLWREGINTFRSYRATEADQVTRFPVFLREESRHTGNKSGLLHDAASLRRAILALRLRGYRLKDLLVVEFCDTRDAKGAYRKYSAFRVGDAIVPAHMMAGGDWMMKALRSSPDEELAREELAYIEQNPHEPLLRRVFDLAHIQFGRIDYGVLNGVPQVWEINTNPTMGRNPGKARKSVGPAVQALKDQARDAYHARLKPAFAALAGEGDRASDEVDVTIDPEVIEQARAELSVIERRRRFHAMAREIYEHPRASTLRSMLRLVAPRSGTSNLSY